MWQPSLLRHAHGHARQRLPANPELATTISLHIHLLWYKQGQTWVSKPLFSFLKVQRKTSQVYMAVRFQDGRGFFKARYSLNFKSRTDVLVSLASTCWSAVVQMKFKNDAFQSRAKRPIQVTFSEDYLIRLITSQLIYTCIYIYIPEEQQFHIPVIRRAWVHLVTRGSALPSLVSAPDPHGSWVREDLGPKLRFRIPQVQLQ